VNDVARLNVLQSMAQIRSRSAYIKKALDEDKVDLIGGMYDVSTGKVAFFEK
jgi:carbonic anhydrase